MANSYQDAINAAGKYQWETVSGTLSDLRDALASGEVTTVEGLDERLAETCNDCETVIYTERAWVYCLGTRNDDAYLDQTGEEPDTIEIRASYALRRDVEEHRDYQEMVDALENDTVADYLKSIRALATS